MYFEKNYMQQFRDSDEDGLIGARGYIHFFQDSATEYMHKVGRGNDTLPEEFGISWVYTKYKIHIYQKLGFTAPIQIRIWASQLNSARCLQDMEIKQGDTLMMVGRVESCLAHMAEGKLATMDEIQLPEGLVEEESVALARYARVSRKLPPEARLMYEYEVRYTDLDKSHHMNNLHYIDMFLNAYDPEFYRIHTMTDYEIQYIGQCFYGEKLKIYEVEKDQVRELYACKTDGSIATVCLMTCEETA